MAGESIRDRLAALSRGELVGLIALVAVTVGGAGLWYVRSLPQPVAVRAAHPAGRGVAVAPSPSVLLVHVAGWVRDPGVYEFHDGDRIIDAVQAAGGPRKGADLNALNLAGPLTDGSQVLVPQRVASEGSGSSGSTTGTSTTPETVNINTADTTQLETLPGIGEVLAQRIVDYRDENGSFESVDQLEDVSGIGPSILEEVKDLVTV